MCSLPDMGPGGPNTGVQNPSPHKHLAPLEMNTWRWLIHQSLVSLHLSSPYPEVLRLGHNMEFPGVQGGWWPPTVTITPPE